MSKSSVTVVDRFSDLRERYGRLRGFSQRLAEPLEPEDCVVQSMPDVSPTRWHLAHVTWFFETFVLKSFDESYRPRNPQFEYLFNSYYNAVGAQFPRPRRGLLTRPTVREVLAYREQVDEAMERLLDSGPPAGASELIELGLHHEQQHQELLLMDIKHVFSCNPLFPAYREIEAAPASSPGPLSWHRYEESIRHIGHDGESFCYDNELPRHRAVVPAFELASRPVTNEEYLEFVNDGGYSNPGLWLADGWTRVVEDGWAAPLYWTKQDGEWFEFTLHGLRPLEPGGPVVHVSYFEADAYATWSGHRLPSEAEWESAATDRPIEGNFADDGWLHPRGIDGDDEEEGPVRLFGDVWEWTRSAYSPYPGFRPAAGAVGEYNGKFMCGQFVLRGGACVTSRSHIRPTYRNFFYPHQRWQFGGIRLARDYGSAR